MVTVLGRPPLPSGPGSTDASYLVADLASNHTSATTTTKTLSSGSTSSERSPVHALPMAGPWMRTLKSWPSRASRYSLESWSLGSLMPLESTMPSGRQSVMPFSSNLASRSEKATSSPKLRDKQKGCALYFFAMTGCSGL